MKHTFISILLIFSFIFFICACADNNAQTGAADGKINVISVNFPGYDFAREIAGDNINLTLLLQPGAESHSFEPSPQDIIKIQNADIFIYVGGESDSWVKEILSSVKNKNLKVLAMTEIVKPVEEEIKEGMQEEDEHEGEEEEAEYDEHVWTSPINAIAIARAIADAFCEADKANAQTYKTNAEKYTEKLQILDAAFREVTVGAKRKTLIFGDRFPLRYFVDEYGLDYYAAFPGCSTETEASAKTVAFLIDKVKKEQIPVVFRIEFSNGKIAKTICESTGAKNLLFHTCHNVSSDELKSGKSYLTLMADNALNLKEALN
jgi:zinc transport system substrate-binding protein